MEGAHRLGLCSVTFRRLPPEQVVALAVQGGIEAIEWGADVHVPPGCPALARQVAARCRDEGIAVSSYGSYVEAGAAGGAPWEAVLEGASALGAPLVRVWAGRRGRGSAEAAEAHRAAAAEALAGMTARAGALGIGVALEYHPGTLTDTAASALELLGRVAGSAAPVCYWQPRPGVGGVEALQELAVLAPHLSHLHVFAWEADGARLPLAAHRDAWLARLRLSRTLRVRGPAPRTAMLEFVRDDDPAQFLRDAATLADWLREVDGPR